MNCERPCVMNVIRVSTINSNSVETKKKKNNFSGYLFDLSNTSLTFLTCVVYLSYKCRTPTHVGYCDRPTLRGVCVL